MKLNRTFKETLHISGIQGIIMMIHLAGRLIGCGSAVHRIVIYAFS
jgi:hypothetical protein